MIYIPQTLTDAWLLEDIQGGDLTTRTLMIGSRPGTIAFHHRHGGCVSGITPAAQMLHSLGLKIDARCEDGSHVEAGETLLRASGRADALHQGWKAAQNLLEWSCGVADCTANMLSVLRSRRPEGRIACTRKAIPGTRLLGTQAIIAAGGLIHRAGSAETVLLFTNHRCFLEDGDNWVQAISFLRKRSPEKKIAVEADSPDEALAALHAEPDILQLDKFTPAQARRLAAQAKLIAPRCTLAITGGINLTTLPDYLDCGVDLFVTSTPWYAPPADIRVVLQPTQNKA
ncbi:ModD protein [Cedecea colo]|uniref:Putative pyrophosphorylase ModD n=1 Tax=Cedecea colo TaxID=2552946 RepID=A0ABX0VRW0_9ENTR|nr:ModD protein [Cedecea colo]NIY49486.1 ModD protein [Cedecea colo]